MSEEIELLQNQLKNLSGKLLEIKGYLDVDRLEEEVRSINEKMTEPTFWDDNEAAQEMMDRLKLIKKTIDPWKSAYQSVSDLGELVEMLDENQPDTLKELDSEVSALSEEVDKLEFKRLLSDEFDPNNAIVNINSGAGGTEACDWTHMLFRMYTRWAEENGYKVELLDLQQGEEAGIKNSSFLIKGPYAYGYLKAESGVHRLVRISPFDSNKRRHTSFASVDVVAEVEDAPEIEINEADLRIDTYRAGGAGGQHVNKTDSAVRITHAPSGIVVQCQNERSQLSNKNTAMKMLKSRLYEKYRREQQEKQTSKYGAKMKIEWGSQIRSYVFHPYNMVKDLRTQVETSNTGAVMDGDINQFIEGYLKWAANQQAAEGKN